MALTYEQEQIGRGAEILRGLEPKVGGKMRLLLSINRMWQPTDLLPDFAKPDGHEKLRELQQMAAGLSDASLVSIVGDTVTEEALPTYMSWLNRLAIADETGTAQNPWAVWIRKWTAEERRHGVVFRSWLAFSGRVDMRAVDRTTQYLISNGMDPYIGANPIAAMVYVALQEGATDISHKNAGKLAKQEGDTILARIGQAVGGEESRHKEMYRSVVGWAFDEDPNETMIALGNMLAQGITMPAALMDDEGTFTPGLKRRSPLFERFSAVAQTAGIYTVGNYVELVMEQLDYWRVADRQVSGEAAKAQNVICDRFTPNYRDRLEDAIRRKIKREHGLNPPAFSWIHHRAVPIDSIQPLESKKHL